MTFAEQCVWAYIEKYGADKAAERLFKQSLDNAYHRGLIDGRWKYERQHMDLDSKEVTA